MRKISFSKFKRIIYIISMLLIVAIVVFVLWRQNKVKEAEIILKIPKNVRVEEEIDIPINIDTANQNINAAEVYLRFDPADLEVLSVSKDNSFFSLWIKDQPAFSNERGEISFAGGLPNPGFSGRGQIGSIKVKTKRKGSILIEFDQKSRTLLSDGLGTEIKLHLDPINFKVEG